MGVDTPMRQVIPERAEGGKASANEPHVGLDD